VIYTGIGAGAGTLTVGGVGGTVGVAAVGFGSGVLMCWDW